MRTYFEGIKPSLLCPIGFELRSASASPRNRPHNSSIDRSRLSNSPGLRALRIFILIWALPCRLTSSTVSSIGTRPCFSVTFMVMREYPSNMTAKHGKIRTHSHPFISGHAGILYRFYTKRHCGASDLRNSLFLIYSPRASRTPVAAVKGLKHGIIAPKEGQRITAY
jgi:hypothetical protein